MEKYTIRSAEPDDAPALLNIYQYYVENTAVSFEHRPPTAEEFRARICYYRRKYPYLCILEDGEIIGFAFAHAFRERAAYDYAAETTIYLDHKKRRKGAGRIIYTALEKELKKMGVTNIYACIAVPDGDDPHLSNASPLFHEKLGFHTCGTFHNCGRKFGRWYTMIWMEKIIAEYHKTPAPLIPYPEIAGIPVGESDGGQYSGQGISEH